MCRLCKTCRKKQDIIKAIKADMRPVARLYMAFSEYEISTEHNHFLDIFEVGYFELLIGAIEKTRYDNKEKKTWSVELKTVQFIMFYNILWHFIIFSALFYIGLLLCSQFEELHLALKLIYTDVLLFWHLSCSCISLRYALPDNHCNFEVRSWSKRFPARYHCLIRLLLLNKLQMEV